MDTTSALERSTSDSGRANPGLVSHPVVAEMTGTGPSTLGTAWTERPIRACQIPRSIIHLMCSTTESVFDVHDKGLRRLMCWLAL